MPDKTKIALALGALSLPLLALGSTGFATAPDLDAGDSVRLLLLGDTGQLPVDGDPHKMDASQRARLRAALGAQDADAIVDLGDLFYNKAPKCGRGESPEGAGGKLDAHLYDHVGGLDLPVYMVLGNHDVGPIGEWAKRKLLGRRTGKRSKARERCYRLYAQQRPGEMIFPGEAYGVDLGPARLGLLHTSAPERTWPANELKAWLAEDPDDWQILGGHHVLYEVCDKTDEDFVLPWLQDNELQPDLWINGHAHLLQLSVVAGVPAVTSGAGSKLREFPDCDPTAHEGVEFGVSQYGFAVLDITPETLRVSFRDIDGGELHCWQRGRDNPQGEACQ